VCERKIVNRVVHLCGWMAAYILFIFILNILQHIYGIMASVLDTVASGDAFNSVSGKVL